MPEVPSHVKVGARVEAGTVDLEEICPGDISSWASFCPVSPAAKRGTCPSIASRQHGAVLHWGLDTPFPASLQLFGNTIWVSSGVLEAMLEVEGLQEASDCLCSE